MLILEPIPELDPIQQRRGKTEMGWLSPGVLPSVLLRTKGGFGKSVGPAPDQL